MTRPLDLVSIVVPLYNEEAVLPLLWPRLRAVIAAFPAAEVIFVDDGSRDGTAALLAALAATEPRVKVVEFSRNFGHEMAITAGTDLAVGDVVVVMDGDLQDPPEVIPAMLAAYAEGFDVVYGQRTLRHGESGFKKLSARIFYWLMRTSVHPELPDSVGDFRLMSRQVNDAFRRLRERHRFVRGMITWLGFRQTSVQYERPARAAGQTKYPLRSMLRVAWHAITSFSGLPLRIGMSFGFFLMFASLGYVVYTFVQTMVFRATVPGWASLVFLQVGLSGAIIVMLGLVGEYVARIYEEMKGRPLYVVKSMANIEPERVMSRLDPE